MTFAPRKARGVAVFFTDQITVETYQGSDGDGKDIFAAAVTVSGYADDKRSLIRDASGAQVVSNSTIYTYLANRALFTPNSRVTINGDTSLQPRVITANANGIASLRLPDHLSVSLD